MECANGELLHKHPIGFNLDGEGSIEYASNTCQYLHGLRLSRSNINKLSINNHPSDLLRSYWHVVNLGFLASEILDSMNYVTRGRSLEVEIRFAC